MTEMTINKLPSKTWYWLHVNETKLPWDKEHTTELPEETVTAGKHRKRYAFLLPEREDTAAKDPYHSTGR